MSGVTYHPDDLTIQTGQSTAPSTYVGADSNFGTMLTMSTENNARSDPNVDDVGEMLSLSVTPRHDTVGVACKMKSTHICVSVQALEMSRESDWGDNWGCDIVGALDVSGSMSGNKIRQCKNTLKMIIRVLKSKDRFGLVCYSSTAKLVFPAQNMTEANKKVALDKIDTIFASGGTNLSAGLSLAAQELKSIESPNQVRSIFLLTDGHANIGISDTEGLVSLVRSFTGRTIDPPGASLGASRLLYVQDIKDCARRKGMCVMCGSHRTHERVGRCFFKKWKPLTVVDEKGVISVYKGYCLATSCYRSVEEVKSLLGETEERPATHYKNSEDKLDLECQVTPLDDGKKPPTEIIVGKGADNNAAASISVHCFGYGADHDSHVLQAIANASEGGTYYFVENDSNVAGAFGDALGGIMSVVAQCAVITVAVPPAAAAAGVKILKVLHDDAIQRENGSFVVNFGDFYAEETRDLLLELQLGHVLNPGKDLSPVPHLSASLTYTDTINKVARTTAPSICLISRPTGNELSPESVHVATQWLRITMANAIRDADQDAKGHRLEEARARLQDAKSKALSLPRVVQESPVIMTLIQDIDAVIASFQSADLYNSHGTHLSKSRFMVHSNQRCSEFDSGTINSYRTKKKLEMTQRFQTKSK